MKYILYLLPVVVLSFFSCHTHDDHDHDEDIDYKYHAHIHSPNTDDRNINDTIKISVLFESHTGETVHNYEVRIYEKDSKTEIFNKSEHIHATEGKYTFTEDFILSEENGVKAHSNYILEAKVWAHKDEEGLESESIEFHVHP